MRSTWACGALILSGIVMGTFAERWLGEPALNAQPNRALAAIPREITSYRDIVKQVAPAVVSIEARTKGKTVSFGSGLIVDGKGIVLTNFHVVEGAETVEVKLPDGRKFPSKDIRGDRKSDLAIIRMTPDRLLPSLELGDSDKMEVGDRVLAVGAPFGLTGSVTHGIISAKSRNVRINQYEDFLQTDAAINPGNSGGPLISLDGRVIGINSAIKSKSGGFQGVGLAISSNFARQIMDQLLKEGTVRRGYIGVQIRDIDADVGGQLGLAEGVGVLVTRVVIDSPASKAGIRQGDVITTIAAKPVRDGVELQKVVAGLPLGVDAIVSILRGGKPETFRIRIEEQSDEFGIRQPNSDE